MGPDKYNNKLFNFRALARDTNRLNDINEHDYRDAFQRDRDRILYSKEFRRLSGKTQIFVTGEDDHLRTRLTHTLEVAQIAETISRRLGLDEMLIVAIAYAHDIGHTPFGHIGERTLNHIMNGCFEYYSINKNLEPKQKGFKHNLQGVRVATFLEKTDRDEEPGLNLTKFTLWGIKAHTSSTYGECEYYPKNEKDCHHNGCAICTTNTKRCGYKNSSNECKTEGQLSVGFYDYTLQYKGKPILNDEKDWTLEAVIVAEADEIAQRHHDIEDGIYAGLIDVVQLCEYIQQDSRFIVEIRSEIEGLTNNIKKGILSQSAIIRRLSRIIVNNYVTLYSETLCTKMEELCKILNIDFSSPDPKWKEKMIDHFKRIDCTPTDYFCFDEDMKAADKDFSKYLRNHILFSELAQSMDGRTAYVIKQLVKAYLTNPQQLPDRTICSIVDEFNGRKKGSIHSSDNIIRYMTQESYARETLKSLLSMKDEDINDILLRRICDYIAGMTDQYAMRCFEKLYGLK